MTVLRGDDVDKIGKVRRFEVGVDGLVWTNADQNPIEIKPESVIRVDEGEDIPKLPKPFQNLFQLRMHFLERSLNNCRQV